MLSELRKSFNSILYERVASPLYGTIIVTWIIWNWKILYLTFFVDESNIPGTKIDYIIHNYSDQCTLIWFPLFSSILLILIVPFIANGAFWVSLKFQIWRSDKKNELEKKQLLTVEQSLAIRKEMRNQEDEFGKILQKRDEEIENLSTRIYQLQSEKNQLIQEKELQGKIIPYSSISNPNAYSTKDFENLKKAVIAYENFEEIIETVRNKNSFPENVSEDLKKYFLLNDIIVEKKLNDGRNIYSVSSKGDYMYKDFNLENINNLTTDVSDSEYEKFKKNKKAFEWFKKLSETIKEGELPKDIDDKTKQYFLLNNIIHSEYHNDQFGRYTEYVFTDKGEEFYKNYFNETFEKEGNKG